MADDPVASIEFTYTPTADELVALNQYIWKKHVANSWLKCWMFGAVMLAILVVPFASLLSHPQTQRYEAYSDNQDDDQNETLPSRQGAALYEMDIVLGFLPWVIGTWAMAVLIRRGGGIRWLTRRQLKKKPALFAPKTYCIDSAGIRMHGEGMDVVMAWNHIGEVEYAHGLFYIKTVQHAYQYFARHAVPDTAVLVEMLRLHVAKHAGLDDVLVEAKVA